jgi:adenine phosphoribosyltransferase
MMDLSRRIRNIPDFPKKGILFRDITPLLQDSESFREAVDVLSDKYRNEEIDLVVSAEARGFILGACLAYKLGVGFVPVRKPGKLPYEVEKATYELEYGEDTLEMHRDAIRERDRVLVFDDLLATGGTARAICQLVEKPGGKVTGICFLIELTFLKGREKIKDYPVFSLIRY